MYNVIVLEPNQEELYPLFRAPQASLTFSLKTYNNFAVGLHFINAVILFGLCFSILDEKPENVVFISGKIGVSDTNYAVIDVNSKDVCENVRMHSPDYQTMLSSNFAHVKVFQDFMPHHLYDFRNKTAVRYGVPGHVVYTHYMMASFFALSFVFQGLNGIYFGFESSFPRILHYLEYSISSSLMAIVLAVNVGIIELYTLIGFFGMFFGMNILGACAEVFSWVTANYFQNKCLKFSWLLPHLSGWVLFLMVYVPIIVAYERNRDCSAGIPGFLTAAIYVEFFLFCLFGISQLYFLVWRSMDHNAKVEWYMDFTNITLSIGAKTFLAWVLIGPVLSSQSEWSSH